MPSTSDQINTPQQLLFNHTGEEILALAKDIAGKFRSTYDAIAQVPKDQATFDTVIKPMAEVWSSLSAATEYCSFPRHMSPIESVRNASSAAAKDLSALFVELGMRQDVYHSVLAVSEKTQHVDALHPEQKRYLERVLRDYRRNGLHLDAEKRAEIQKIQEEISNLAIQFSKNLAEVKTKFHFSPDQLKGLDEDFLSGLEKSPEGLYTVTLSYPHYFACMKKAVNPETRQTLEKAFQSRCIEENTPLLQRILVLRQRQAELLSYPTHVHYISEIRMAKTPERIAEFLSSLNEKLTPLAKAEIEEMLALKKAECESLGFPFDNRINGWDFRYYCNKVEETRYQVDHNVLKQYFPLATVTNGLFAIYQRVFNIRFEPVAIPEAAPSDDPNKPPSHGIWHPDVTLYNVLDASTEQVYGQFYLDLHPRENKYGHAACFTLQAGCEKTDGSGARQLAVAAMVANFTKATPTRPALLAHDEVETYFHELGHVLHVILARPKYAIFSGTRVERDFVECPSQILENWCWEPESIRLFSGHYETGQPIPDATLQLLLNSRHANAGVFNKRQVLLASFDQFVHSVTGGQTVDVAKVFADLAKTIWGIEATPGTSMPANFEHLVGGYDGQYYGYLWSEVYSADIFFSRFQPEGILNPKVGKEYREKILQPGGSKDAWDMVVDFLGREPSLTAFLRSKGLSV